jgi:hypothetical protein
MNLFQVIKQARFEIDALRVGNVVSSMWQDEEAISGVNIAMDKTARLLRLCGSDVLTQTTASTDTSRDLTSEIYNPSSLRILPNVTDYTLPPDFVRVANLRATTIGFEGVKFHPSSINNKTFSAQQSINANELPSANNSDQEFWYIIVGSRTLRIAPTPKDTIDVELTYHFRPRRLRYTTTGTIQRTASSATVSGSGTTWLSNDGLQAPAELLVGALTSISSAVTLDGWYPRVKSVDSDTSMTMARSQLITDGLGQAYALVSVPRLPEEHHTWLAQLAAAIMVRKVDTDMSAKLQADLAQDLLTSVLPEVTLRQLQESLITEAFELPS